MENSKKRELSSVEIKEISLRILKNIDLLCKKNGITYYLAYGTLLGAVRHQGFIPWDDDIDIWVPFSDFEKLMKVLDEQSPYLLLNCLNHDKWVRGFSKLYDQSTLVVDNFVSPYNSVNRGVAVDIFPLFYMSKDDKLKKKITHTHLMMSRMNNYKAKIYNSASVQSFVFKTLNFLGRNNLYYRKRLFALEDMQDGAFVGNITSPYGMKDCFKKRWFAKGELQFEGAFFCVPKEYDSVLRQLYGNYMELPPIEKRVQTHDTITYYLGGTKE